MNKLQKKCLHKSRGVWLVTTTTVLFFAFFSAQSLAATPTVTQTDEDKLVEKITGDVIKQLRNSGYLEKEIDAGIIRFVKKQQEAQARAPDKKAENVRPVSIKDDHIYGNPNAEISLIEYSDYECPFCKRFHATPKQVVDAYKGKVNWVYRHFPLGFHNPGAQKQAEASECAAELGGNDAFWKYSDFLYQRTTSNGKGFPVTNLVPLAVEIGIDKKKFEECFNSGRHEARVKRDYENGVQSGISGTPGNILLNNKTGKIKAKSGAVPANELKKEIDRLSGQ